MPYMTMPSVPVTPAQPESGPPPQGPPAPGPGPRPPGGLPPRQVVDVEDARGRVVVGVALGQDDPPPDDDRAVPVSAAGRQLRQWLGVERAADHERAAELVVH